MRHGTRVVRVAASLAAVVALLGASPRTTFSAPVVPDGFAVENAVPGTTFILPTTLAFLPDGRMLVGEKRGVVWVVANGAKLAQPLWSAEREVLANGDRGLVGLDVDPHYGTNHRVYFYYTVDPDSDGDDDEIGAFTRLVRYTTLPDDSNRVDPNSRTILLGRTWSDGLLSPTLSHAVDCLRFGSDGSLLLTHGDGSHFDQPDGGGLDSESFAPGRGDPLADIGAFRAQYLNTMSGKLLRINPETGAGYASNPYAGGDLRAPRARIWAYGFRNPFRFCMKPGTGSTDTSAANPGTAYVGDVGANRWEELDVVHAGGGTNFGWPCREGPGPYAMYANLSAPRADCSTIGTASNPAQPTNPTFTWNHDDSTLSAPYGLRGNCTAGGLFYTASHYPAQFHGRLFFGDYGAGWLRVATMDSLDAIVSLQDFASGLQGPVDFELDPRSGEIFYASIYANEVRRIRYIGGEASAPPVAQASATPLTLVAPDTVRFSSLGSFDPQGNALAFAWSFGDGSSSSAAQPAHVYVHAGTYDAILTVTTAQNAIAHDTVTVIALAHPGFPVTPIRDAFARGDGPLGTPWSGYLSGLAIRDSALVQSAPTNYAMFTPGFGANQEVFVTLDSIAQAPEHDLLLKVQGTSWTAGAIQVVYDATQGVIAVSTYAPGIGWKHIAGPWRGIHFAPGDRFGARAYAHGVLDVYRNQEVLGRCRVDTWPWSAAGGRIGFMLRGAAGSRLTNFGGGDLPLRDDVPPVARILEPLDGSFFVAGHTVLLRGLASDAEDPTDSLPSHWEVTLHHNNHFHPDILTFDAPVDSFVAENHDDGTGISLILSYRVTDTQGVADTSQITIYPEVDLTPASLVTAPADPTGAGPVTWALTIANRGRMPAPRSHWRLLADGIPVAEGDTLLGALDSVRVVRALPPLVLGPHTLRAEVDALGAVRETDESNNTVEHAWAPLPFPSAPLRDTFERADGAPGSPWLGSLAGLAIQGEALAVTAPAAYAVWNGGVFGAEQEAYVRFAAVTPDAPEQSLLLGVQRTTWSGGAVSVAWSATSASVSVFTYSPVAGWVRRGGPWRSISFKSGDQFGARMSAGRVMVYRNGIALGAASLGDWEFAGRGGRIGLLVRGATLTRLVDFGGGDVRAGYTHAPHATILAPGTGAIVPPGEVLALRGAATDADSLDTLRTRWRVALAGGVVTRRAPADTITLPPALRDSLAVALIVTDVTGRTDTARVLLRAGTPALDRFERADGPPGSSWQGTTSSFAVRGGALIATGASGYLTWAGGVFGASQEVWVQFDSVSTSAPEHDLLLKSQGPSWSAGAVQVTWSATQSLVTVNTYAPGVGWTRRGGPWRGVTFAPGDRFGARAFADGRVRVYQNGIALGETTLGDWPYATAGGRIGVLLAGAAGTRITRFGGGTLAPPSQAGGITRGETGDAGAIAAAPDVREIRVSGAEPNPTSAGVAFALELPRAARVSFEIYDLAGRSMARHAEPFPAGRTRLAWDGRTPANGSAPAGIYLARVLVEGHAYLRRFAIVR